MAARETFQPLPRDDGAMDGRERFTNANGDQRLRHPGDDAGAVAACSLSREVADLSQNGLSQIGYGMVERSAERRVPLNS